MDVRHLLVPTDFSEGSKQAFEYALEVARTCGAKLTLLHVVELPSYLSDGHTQAHVTTALHDHMQSPHNRSWPASSPRVQACR